MAGSDHAIGQRVERMISWGRMKLASLVPDSISIASSPSRKKAESSCGSTNEILRLYHDPLAWRRWLDWVPKVCLPPHSNLGSPFASPANTSLQQKIFLNGTAIEFPQK